MFNPQIFVPALILAAIIGYFIRKVQVTAHVDSLENKAKRLLEEADRKHRETLLDAKTKALEITEGAKKEEAAFRQQILLTEQRLERRENEAIAKLESLDKEKSILERKQAELDALKAETEKIKEQQLERLNKIANLSAEQAKQLVMQNAERMLSDDLVSLSRKMMSSAREEADRNAKDLIAQAMERVAADVTSETTTTTVHLPSEEMKGRIIGKEGRNIKTFEQLMGVEIIVDDSPDTVLISGFNSIRRHIAKYTLEKLLKDGRIHPARIEELYEKSKQEVAEMIKEAGEEAVHDLGIINFPPKLINLIGRLKFRTSYGQNILKHSVEMAKMAAIIAEEMGADVNITKQGALLHDIGKALDQEIEGTHVEIGRRIAEKFNLDPRVINAIESHHYDTDVSERKTQHLSLEASIVDVTDAISSSRPGARRDSYENYVKRLEDLEAIAKSFDGVEKTYAVQAGREVRVFVVPDKVDDWGATKLAREIANKIEQELRYPGEVRVNVIREKRVVEYAR